MENFELQTATQEHDSQGHEKAVVAPEHVNDQGTAPLDLFFGGASGESQDGGPTRLMRSAFLAHSANGAVRAIAFKRAQQTYGNRFVQRAIAGRSIQRHCSCGGTCEKYRAEEEALSPSPAESTEDSACLVQRQTETPSTTATSESNGHDVIPPGSGEPLDQMTRGFMESRFSTDFGQVRVHTSTFAAESAEALNAVAYTAGRDIYFAEGKYSPQTREGQHLIAHELTHTIQQGEEATTPKTVAAKGHDGVVIGPTDDPLPSSPLCPSPSGILQRKCACGGEAGISGECEECRKKKRLGLQTKLKVSKSGDLYEQEADRIADQVMARPAHTAISTTPPRLQRFSEQSDGQMDEAPASVDQALGSPGRPLEPALRQDMEQRFDYDFSNVRLHADAVAEQSAQDVNAHAFTVGADIVFGKGKFAPETHEGLHLIAHELTHTVQQKDGVGVQSSEMISHPDDRAKGVAESMADNLVRARDTAERKEARPSVGPPAIQRQAMSAIQRDDETTAGAPAKAGFGNQPRALGQPGFGNQPHAVGQAGVGPAPAPEVTSLDIRWEPADNIERFKRIWMTSGNAEFENYVYKLLGRMSSDSGPNSVDRFADRFWDYVWLQIGGRITNDPTVQMMVGIAATVISQQKRIKAEIEEKKKYLAFFEEQARKYTRDRLKESETRMHGELKHYGLTFPDDASSFATWAMETTAARRGLGIAAAGLARRRNALIKANADYRNMVRGWGHYRPYAEIEPVEIAQRQAIRDYEVFRLQVIPRFPIFEEFSSPEIDPFSGEDAEPDDTQGEKLNMLAQMAEAGSSKEATDYIVDTVFEKLRNIDKVRKEINPGGEVNIWCVPEIVQGTRELIGAASDTAESELIEQKFAQENRPRNESEGLLGKILFWGGLLLAPFTGFYSLAPYMIYNAGKVAYKTYEDRKEYMTKKALHGTDFGAAAISAEDPSLFWLASDILNAGLAIMDLATLAAPAARIFRRLAPFARLAREVEAGEKALTTLKNAAEELASTELRVGAKEAGEFAEKVMANARAARSDAMAGMTAKEAKMLEQADAHALEKSAVKLEQIKHPIQLAGKGHILSFKRVGNELKVWLCSNGCGELIAKAEAMIARLPAKDAARAELKGLITEIDKNKDWIEELLKIEGAEENALHQLEVYGQRLKKIEGDFPGVVNPDIPVAPATPAPTAELEPMAEPGGDVFSRNRLSTRGLEPDTTLEAQLGGTGQLTDLQNSPNLKGVGGKDLPKLTPRQLAQMVEEEKITKNVFDSIMKAGEGRNLGGGN